MPPDSDQPVESLISIGAAAKAIGINKSTLSRQVSDGKIRSHQGKVRLSEVIEDRAKNIGSGASRSSALHPQRAAPEPQPDKPLHAPVASSATVQRDATLQSDATPGAKAPAVPSHIGGWISIGAAAKAIGINKSTLSRQVRAGAIRSNEDGKVKLTEVLEDRAKNIDLSQSRRAAQASLPLKPKTGSGGGEAQETEGLEDIDDLEVLVDGKVMSFADAQRLKETYLGKLRRLEFLEKVGTLVDRKAAEKLFFDMGRESRDAWMNWPARTATLMASELGVEAPLLTETLIRYVRQHLAEIGEPPAPEFA